MKNCRRRLTVPVSSLQLLHHSPLAENVCSSTEDVREHPRIACIKGSQSGVGLVWMTTSPGRSMDICPSGNYRTEDHQAKRQQNERSDTTSRQQHFTISDHDDGQVLENREHWYRKELQSLSACVDLSYQQHSYREPCQRSVSNWAFYLGSVAAVDPHDFALPVLNLSRLRKPICLHARTANMQTIDYSGVLASCADPGQLGVAFNTHLNGEIQKHEIPIAARDHVFVDDSHTDGC